MGAGGLYQAGQALHGESALASSSEVLHVLKGVVIHVAAVLVECGDECLQAVEVDVLGEAAGLEDLVGAGGSVESLEDVVGSHPLGNLEGEVEVGLVGLLALHDGVEVVQLDVAGGDSRVVALVVDRLLGEGLLKAGLELRLEEEGVNEGGLSCFFT